MDSGGPPQRALCFLSTLLSQKVPEKSDVVLRCMISGQPKPEVTWYKNGQTIEECGIISSYEFFQNQYIHMLHLYCCTQDDAAVYQVSAKNGQGMICCSASIEVDRETPEASGLESTAPPDSEKATARTSWAAPLSADSPSSQSHDLAGGQSLANGDLSASSADHPRSVEATRQTEEVVHGQLQPESSPAPGAQGGHCPPGSVPHPISREQGDALSHEGPNDAALNSPPNPKAEKYISFSLPLPPPTADSGTPGQPATCPEHPSPRLASDDSDSDYELCPEITFTYTEEFSDDDLEYLECSDVMTDYSNAIWQRSLQGAERFFLLESDDEEPEFSERGLEGCELPGSEAGCGPRVSGDTAPMDTTPDVCGHHSQPREVGVRSHRASPHHPSSPMTLAQGPHRAGLSTVADQRGYKRPIASEASGNDYPGIPGETRAGHRAGEEFRSDNLLNMDAEGAGTQPGELGRDQGVEPEVKGRAGEKGPSGRRSSEKPSRGTRPGMKGKVKKLRGSTPRGPPIPLLRPTEPVKQPLAQAEDSEGPCAEAEATVPDAEAAGEGAFLSHVQPEAPPLQTQASSVPQEGSSGVEGEGRACFKHLLETGHAPDGSDAPQAETHAPCGELGSLGPASMAPYSVGEKEASTGFTKTWAGPDADRQGPREKHMPGIRPLEAEGCAGRTQLGLSANRAEGLGPARSVREARGDPTPCSRLMAARVHRGAPVEPGEPEALSEKPPEPPDTDPILDCAGPGPASGEERPGEHFQADGPGISGSPEPLSGDLGDGQSLPEVSSRDLELADGQGQEPEAFDSSDEGPGMPVAPSATRGSSPDPHEVKGPASPDPAYCLDAGEDESPVSPDPAYCLDAGEDESPVSPDPAYCLDAGEDESPVPPDPAYCLDAGEDESPVSPDPAYRLDAGEDEIPVSPDPAYLLDAGEDESPVPPDPAYCLDAGEDESPLSPDPAYCLDAGEDESPVSPDPAYCLDAGEDENPVSPNPAYCLDAGEDESPLSPDPAYRLDAGEDESPVSPDPAYCLDDREDEIPVSPDPAYLLDTGEDESPVSPDPAYCLDAREDESPLSPDPAYRLDAREDESPVSPDPAYCLDAGEDESPVSPDPSYRLDAGEDESPVSPDPAYRLDTGEDESPVSPDPACCLDAGEDESPVSPDPACCLDAGEDESPVSPDPAYRLDAGEHEVPASPDPAYLLDPGEHEVLASPDPAYCLDPEEDEHPVSPDPACSPDPGEDERPALAEEDSLGETVLGGPSPGISAGLRGGRPQAPEVEDMCSGAPHTADPPASDTPGETHHQETLAPPCSSLDGLRGAGDMLAEVTPGLLVAACSGAESLQGRCPQAPDDGTPQQPPSPSPDAAPAGPPEQGHCPVPAGSNVPLLVTGAPRLESDQSKPPLEVGDELRVEAGVDSRKLQVCLPEHGGALAPRESPGPPLRGDFQAGLSPTAAEGAATPQTEPAVPPRPLATLSQALLGAWDGGPAGQWGAGRKLRIITLEAPLPEGWTLGLPGAELASGKDPSIADRVPARTAMGVAYFPGATRDHGPLSPLSSESSESIPAEPRDGAQGIEVASPGPGNQQTQCVGHAQLLESSVDPTDEGEFCDAGGLPEGPQTREKVDVGLGAAEPETRGSFLQQLLTRAGLLESSVDPLEGTGVPVGASTDTQEPLGCTVGTHTSLRAPCRPPSGETIGPPHEDSLGADNVAPGHHGKRPLLRASGPHEGEQMIPQGNQSPAGSEGSVEACSVLRGLLGPLALTTEMGADMGHVQDQAYRVPRRDLGRASGHQPALPDPAGRGAPENECGSHGSFSGGFAPSAPISDCPGTPAPTGPNSREPLIGESPATCASPTLPSPARAQAPESQRDPNPARACRTRDVAGPGYSPPGPEAVRKKRPEPPGSGHLAEGVKRKILSRVAALRQRLERKEKDAGKGAALPRRGPPLERSGSRSDERKDPKKPACRRGGKAPVLLKKIQAERLPDHPGNLQLSCQFAEIHEDSTIRWTKDSESIAQVQRSAGDNSTVSLPIVQAGQKDQGRYYCCLNNSFGKVTAEFNLTAQVLQQLSSCPEDKGCEDIEFSQLLFREDFLRDSYFGARLRGRIATEARHFGEGVHRKAFRSRVLQGLLPVFQPGHACVLKVHNAVAYGTRSNDELVQRNYKLAAQECYVQNTARHYAEIYAAEAQPLEGFGEVPEIIPIFLIHRPENNIPYATVEEELMGEFVKYSMRDGKEINFSRRDSEAGQKCCTFQHWVYQKTSGCLLVTDMQGVGMKLTDVGIATLAKGYKGFKGNCSMSFIDQFKALHQCNKYCKMLGLQSLQSHSQKQKKPGCSVGKGKAEPPSRRPAAGSPEKKP